MDFLLCPVSLFSGALDIHVQLSFRTGLCKMRKVTEQKFTVLYYLVLAGECIQFGLANAALCTFWKQL